MYFYMHFIFFSFIGRKAETWTALCPLIMRFCWVFCCSGFWPFCICSTKKQVVTVGLLDFNTFRGPVRLKSTKVQTLCCRNVFLCSNYVDYVATPQIYLFGGHFHNFYMLCVWFKATDSLSKPLFACYFKISNFC